MELKSRENIIDNLMNYLCLSDLDTRVKRSKLHDLPLNYFKECEILIEDSNIQDSDWAIFTDVKPSDINNKYDISIIGNHFSEKEDDTSLYWTSRFRSLPLRSCQGKVTRMFPSMAEFTMSIINKNGTYNSCLDILGFNGKKWVPVLDRGFDKYGFSHKSWSHRDEEINRNSVAALGIAFSRQYMWRAVIGLENEASISFSIHPNASKSLFKLRDAPPNKDRRSAIRNWVSEHWRINHKDPDPDQSIEVKRHLRGQTKFKWNGWIVEIIPAPFDANLNSMSVIKKEQEK